MRSALSARKVHDFEAMKTMIFPATFVPIRHMSMAVVRLLGSEALEPTVAVGSESKSLRWSAHRSPNHTEAQKGKDTRITPKGASEYSFDLITRGLVKS